MAEHFLSLGEINNHSVLIPAPQHTGKAEYTKAICDLVASVTGANVADMLQRKPGISLYEQKLQGIAELELFKSGIVPDGKLFFVDNVLATGTTYRKACEALGATLEPLVYAIDTGKI